MRYISLFSGIEAATVAWEPLAWEPVAFCEIDEFPSAVLAHRFPNVPNLGDITKVDWSDYVGSVDLVIGGSPCQSFSIAGKREGLKGESGLMFEYIRCVREVRPRWFIWENVPGAFSSEKGAAFRQLLTEMDDCGYGLAWRVLDAQFFGVAQRRRRVFLVGSLGDQRAAEVLFEPDCLRWDHPSSREKRKELTRAAQERVGEGCLPINTMVATRHNKLGEGTGFGVGEEGDPAYTITTNHEHAVCAPSYTMLVRCGKEGGGKGALIQEDVSATLACANIQTLFQPTAYGFCAGNSAKAGGIGFQPEQSPTLRAGESGTNMVPTVLVEQPHAVAFAQNTRDEVRYVNGDGDISGALAANPGMKQTSYVLVEQPNGVCTFHQNQVGDVHITDEMAGTITAGSSVSRQQLVCVPRAFSFDSLASNSMKSSNPHSGCREVDVAKTLDTTNPCPSKNQGDIAILQPQPTYCIQGTIARGARMGQNGSGITDDGLSYTLDTLDVHAVAAPVCMASGQANAEIEYDMAPAQSARQYKDPPILCVADDNANAAIDEDMSGSLKVGGGKPYVVYQATEKTSSEHSAPETSRESEANTSARGR